MLMKKRSTKQILFELGGAYMYPYCNEILKLASDYDIIPVCREIYADVVTPITLLRKIAAVSKRYYLLESIEGGKNGAGIRSWDMIL